MSFNQGRKKVTPNYSSVDPRALLTRVLDKNLETKKKHAAELRAKDEEIAHQKEQRELDGIEHHAKLVARDRGLDAVTGRRLRNGLMTERTRCARQGEAFDQAFFTDKFLHEHKRTQVAPVPKGKKAETRQELLAQHNETNRQLREMGLEEIGLGNVGGSAGTGQEWTR